MSNRPGIVKNTSVALNPVLVGENKVENLPDNISRREDLLQQASEIFQQAQKERDDLLAKARAERDSLLNTARIERDDIHRRAYEEGKRTGHQEGLKAGTDQGKNEFQNAQQAHLKKLESIVTTAEQSLTKMCQQNESEIIDLVVQIAQKVIHHEIERTEDFILTTVRQTINRAVERREVTLRLHPEDLENVREHRATLLGEFDDLRVLRFEADPRVSKGGCLLETASGCVDGRIEQQLGEIHKALKPAAQAGE